MCYFWILLCVGLPFDVLVIQYPSIDRRLLDFLVVESFNLGFHFFGRPTMNLVQLLCFKYQLPSQLPDNTHSNLLGKLKFFFANFGEQSQILDLILNWVKRRKQVHIHRFRFYLIVVVLQVFSIPIYNLFFPLHESEVL